MDSSQIMFLIIMGTAIVLFMTSWVRVDIVGILIILSLAITKILGEKEALSGFASEPAIIVGAVFVLSAGLTNTGATDLIGHWIGRISGKSETFANFVVMVGVAAMSAFTHHLMVTAMMLPIVMNLCRKRNFSPSRMLIPMATAASLGTTLTLIGAPAFLLANQIIQRSGAEPLHLFSVSKVGIPLVLVSFLLITVLRWMLPEKSGTQGTEDRFKHNHISTELIIPNESRWIGKTLLELKEETKDRFHILSVFRGGSSVAETRGDRVLQMGDVMLVETGSDELVSVEEKLGLALRAFKKYVKHTAVAEGKEETTLAEEENNIIETVIGPRSSFIGKTLSQIEFFDQFGVAVVALWRKNGWIREKLSQVVLSEGDVIVLWGPPEKLEMLSEHQDFLVFMPFHGQSKKRIRIPVAFGIMAASILIASFGWLPAHIAFLAGAVAMILTGCVNMDKAYQSIETKVFVMIAGVIPLGLAMQKVGVDKMAAEIISNWTQGMDPFWTLMLFFWFAALLTQIMSDAATTVLIAPIAVAFATAAGYSPVATVVCVTIGAIASFLTPIGHHGNLIVLNPGGYSFGDFLKIGLPLTLVISIITCYLSLRIWT